MCIYILKILTEKRSVDTEMEILALFTVSGVISLFEKIILFHCRRRLGNYFFFKLKKKLYIYSCINQRTRICDVNKKHICDV